MSQTVDAILDEAMALSQKDRAEIAYQLIQTLDGPLPDPAEQAEIDAAWAEEIARRMLDTGEGRTALIPGDEVMRKLRAGRQP